MKKVALSLLALTFVGASAFGDDAAAAPKPIGTFTAWNEGIVQLYKQSGGSDATVGWGPAWNNVTGIDQEWSFGYDGKDYGFSGTLEFGQDNFGNSGVDAATGAGVSAPSLSWFGTYYKFNKYLELQVGKLRVGDYRPAGTLIEGNWATRIASSEFGPLLQVTLVDNLSLGVFANINQGALVKNYPYFLNYGAAYTVPNLGKATATYRNVDRILNGGVSVSVLAPATITAAFQTQADNSSSIISKKFTASIGGDFVENFTTNLDVGYSAANGSDDALGFEVQAQYAIGAYALGARVGYENVAGGGGTLLWGNTDGIDGSGGFEIYPYGTVNFDNSSSVTIGFFYTSGGIKGSESLVEIPITYVWSF